MSNEGPTYFMLQNLRWSIFAGKILGGTRRGASVEVLPIMGGTKVGEQTRVPVDENVSRFDVFMPYRLLVQICQG